MILKKADAAGSKMAVRGGILEVSKEGVVEVQDKAVATMLIRQGWSIVQGSPKPKAVEIKAEPKEIKAEFPVQFAGELEAKVESPKEDLEDRPKFKRGVSSGRRSKKS